MCNVEYGHTTARSFCLNTYLSCTATKEGLEICIIVGNLHNGKECIIESGAGTCAFRTGRLPSGDSLMIMKLTETTSFN